jgi:hypothetical protein
MPTPIEVPHRERWARVRFAIIGPLLAAPPSDGELQAALAALAAKTWRHPLTGLDVQFGVSTIERWYDTARAAPDPVAVLRNRVRANRGAFPSLRPAAREALQAQYRDHPGWTAQLHRDNLAVTLAGTATPVPSYPSVRRYLKAHGMVRRAAPKRDTAGALAARDRLEQREVRSFEVEHVGALWRMRSPTLCAVGFREVGQGA